MDYSRKTLSNLIRLLGNGTPILAQNSKQIVRLTRRLTDSSRDNTCSSVGYHASDFKYSVGGLFETWLARFKQGTISEPKESIQHILQHVLGITRLSDVYKLRNTILGPEKIMEFESLCEKRLQRMPVQYVLKEWDFRNMNLKMLPPVFIPRPETEQLIDIIAKVISHKKLYKILDLCCGSGAIGLSLLQENITINAVAVDQCRFACELTAENAKRNDLTSRIHVIKEQIQNLKLQEKFDVIVSNPPYIFSEDLANLQPEIKLYEDLKALDGGKNGMDVIRIILRFSSDRLNVNGKLFLEVEPRHPLLLHDYLVENRTLGLTHVKTHKDFCGKDRFVEIIKL